MPCGRGLGGKGLSGAKEKSAHENSSLGAWTVSELCVWVVGVLLSGALSESNSPFVLSYLSFLHKHVPHMYTSIHRRIQGYKDTKST